MKKICGNN